MQVHVNNAVSFEVRHSSSSSVCLYMSCVQGSRGPVGQEGVAGLDGEEVD